MISLTGKKKKNNGFLFIELMVSILIMAAGFVMILNCLLQSMKASEYSKDYFKACLFLENKAYEIYNSERNEGFSKGGFTDKFSWELNMAKLEEARLNEIFLKVLWNERNKVHEVYILTYL